MNNTMVREIRGAKINPKSSFKIRVRKIRYLILGEHEDSVLVGCVRESLG